MMDVLAFCKNSMANSMARASIMSLLVFTRSDVSVLVHHCTMHHTLAHVPSPFPPAGAQAVGRQQDGIPGDFSLLQEASYPYPHTHSTFPAFFSPSHLPANQPLSFPLLQFSFLSSPGSPFPGNIWISCTVLVSRQGWAQFHGGELARTQLEHLTFPCISLPTTLPYSLFLTVPITLTLHTSLGPTYQSTFFLTTPDL